MPIRATRSTATSTAFNAARAPPSVLLPPENATGNYVKVVQRVPVKITFDSTDNLPLGPGHVGRFRE